MPKHAKLLTDDTFQLAAELLDGLGVEWAAVGGQVANEYRQDQRLTFDFDFLVKSLEGIQDELEKLGFEVIRYPSAPSPRDSDMGLIRANREDERLDFTLADYEYQFEAIDRAHDNDGIITIEDVLIQKLNAWRPRDQDDLQAIMRTQPELDSHYVKQWCQVFETTERLATIAPTRNIKREQVDLSQTPAESLRSIRERANEIKAMPPVTVSERPADVLRAERDR